MKQVVASAPGKICFAGEDIDWSVTGPVILGAIDIRTQVSIRGNTEKTNIIKIVAEGSVNSNYSYHLGKQNLYSNHELDYIVAALNLFQGLGVKLHEMEIEITSNLPAQAGVGSSSAVSIAIIGALNEYYSVGLDIQDICHYAYLVESKELNIGSGQMDMYVCGMGGVLHLNTRSIPINEILQLSFPSNIRILLVDFKKPSATAEAVARNKRRYDEKDPDMIDYITNTLKLVDDIKLILMKNDANIDMLAQCISNSHDNMRFKLKATNTVIDDCVDLLKQDGVIAVKKTGGGSDGCIFALIYEFQVPSLIQKLSTYPVKSFITKITSTGLEVKSVKA